MKLKLTPATVRHLIWLTFIVTRLIIFFFPPPYVRYFEEYANIWYYGLTPYLEHYFEYPPGTIPLILTPLLADLAGFAYYAFNLRLMMFIFDLLLFKLILKLFDYQKFSPKTKLLSAIFYLLITLKAKDFMYDTLDLSFVLALLLSAAAPFIYKSLGQFTRWLSFWLAIALKYINAPLAVAWAFLDKNRLKSSLPKAILSFFLVWFVPLIIFRSSLLVTFVYHSQRGLQADAIPSLIVRAINIFTRSEAIELSQFKSFDMLGPLSTKMLPLSTAFLFISMIIFGLYSLKLSLTHKNSLALSLKLTLIFIFTYLTFNKVFSTPYHLWYLPFIAVYPYASSRQRLIFFIVATIFAGVATTAIPPIPIGPTHLPTLLLILTQIPACLFLLFASIHLPQPSSQKA